VQNLDESVDACHPKSALNPACRPQGIFTMKVLVYYFHPTFYPSHVNSKLLESISDLCSSGVVSYVHPDEEYESSGYRMTEEQIKHEQERILGADVIVFQFSCQWYSTPPSVPWFLQQVFQEGFAYGPKRSRASSLLKGKRFVPVITFGTPREGFADLGITPQQVALPLITTARFCGMIPGPAFFSFRDSDVFQLSHEYRAMIESYVKADS